MPRMGHRTDAGPDGAHDLRSHPGLIALGFGQVCVSAPDGATRPAGPRPDVNETSRPDLASILGDVTEAEARAALARLVESPTLRTAPQLAAFLGYIVNTALAGRQSEIKGYTIAVEALGRPADFDPVTDPIVRVEAGRLRRALDTHYAADGLADPVRLLIRRGSYVPQFERWRGDGASPAPDQAAPTATTAAPVSGDEALVPAVPPSARPRVQPVKAPAGPARRLGPVLAGMAVLVLVGAGLVWGARTWLAENASLTTVEELSSVTRQQPTVLVVGMTGTDPALAAAMQNYDNQLTDALARFDEFSVLKAGAAATTAAPTYRFEHAAQFLSSSMLQASSRLVHAPTGRVVWTSSIEMPSSALGRNDQIREMARLAAVRMAQPYGLIHADLRAQNIGGGPVQCVVRTYDYWSEPSSARHASVRDCLEATVRNDPLYHPAWSLLAMIHLDEYRIGYNPMPGSALERARRAAQRAVTLAPESARALQALMAVQTVSGETDEALRTGFEAVRRNPFDTDILADLGARLTQAGRPREGRPLLLRAAEVNRARPVWHEFYLFLSARGVGDAEGARAAVRALELADAPLALLARAVAASDLGQRDKALLAMRQLAQLSPIFGDNAGDFLDRAFFAPDVRAGLLQALEAGGLSELAKG